MRAARIRPLIQRRRELPIDDSIGSANVSGNEVTTGLVEIQTRFSAGSTGPANSYARRNDVSTAGEQ